MKFALYFGNRGFFPGELVAAARDEMKKAVEKAGHDYLIMDEKLTKYGAIETLKEGELYAEFLKKYESEIDGAIICMPNFCDENGAQAAFRNFKKPILIQAYPDEIGKMDFASRRDAFCGKFSIMDVFYQFGIKYTVFKPHVCNPLSKEFLKQIDKFAKICAVVNNMKQFKLGVIGARTTAFKTVRYDELAMQRHGITVDTFDLSEVFDRVEKYKDQGKTDAQVKEFLSYANFSKIPKEKIELMAKTTLVVKEIIDEYGLNAISLRCWTEFPQILGISVCAIVSYFNNIGMPCSCEIDVCNAVTMKALLHATGNVSACLDWNNNYGEEDDKCILFHCGPVPQDMMTGKGDIGPHKMFEKSYGEGCAFGVNEGRIKPGEFTFAGLKTENGKLDVYIGEGEFTKDKIEEEFFGCGGVARIKGLEDILMYIGKNGHRHHTAVAFGLEKDVLEEALGNYLGYQLKVF